MTKKSGHKSCTPKSSSPKDSPKTKAKKGIKDEKLIMEIDRLITSPGAFALSPACDNHSPQANDDDSELIKCVGPCGRYFHLGCITDDIASSKDLDDMTEFKCKPCRAKRDICRVCFKPIDDIVKERCQMEECGKYYHQKCISYISGVIIKEGSILRCPSHVCASCFLEDPETPTTPSDELIHCKRCSRAYHHNDLCVPAGSEEINLSFISCPVHERSVKIFYSTSFCVICHNSKSPRINCSTCPRSFHQQCLGLARVPSIYECDDCRSNKQPRYAQVVWMKSSVCRWWPCEVIHPRNAPMNIAQMKHGSSEFLVHYIGSNDYGWVSRSQTIPYESGLKSNMNNPIVNASSSKDRLFNKGLRLAKCFHDVYVSILIRRGLPFKSVKQSPLTDEELAEQITSEAAAALGILDQGEAEAQVLETANERFKKISENYFTSEELKKLTERPLPDTLCGCANTACSSTPRCSEDSGCRNVLECIECNSKVCSIMAQDASIDCGNQKFSKGPAKVKCFLTVNKGIGLKVMKDVPEGNFIIEYVGEVIDGPNEANRRLSKAVEESSREGAKAVSTDSLRGTHLLQFTPDLVIDAEKFGNCSRFINHSCEPNARTRVVNVDGTLRMGLFNAILLSIFALRKLEQNEEVTLNYCASMLLDAYFILTTTVCVCDAPKCTNSLDMPRQFYRPKEVSSEMVVEEDDDVSSTATSGMTSKEKDQELMRPPAAPTRHPASQSSVASTVPRRSGRHSNAIHSITSHKTALPPSNENQPPSRFKSSKSLHYPLESRVLTIKIPRTGQPIHDSECYRCRDSGELITCGKIDCPKVYHIGCLGLSRAPGDHWYCPWHFCDLCGKWASYLCHLCTNSFCHDHVTTEDGRELIRVHELDKDYFDRMNKLVNRSYLENPAARDELLAVNIMRVLWVCYMHVPRNDTINSMHGTNLGSHIQPSAINDRNCGDEAPREVDSEPANSGSTEAAALSVSDEMNEESALPSPGAPAVADEENPASGDVGEEMAKMD
ncbi:hypothetical protein Aperf_G00000040164 [Anoplocephala perfoliata]